MDRDRSRAQAGCCQEGPIHQDWPNWGAIFPSPLRERREHHPVILEHDSRLGCAACSQSSHKRQDEEMAWPAPHVACPGSGCLFMFCSISSSMAFCCSEDIAKTLRETTQDRVGKETVVPDLEVLTYGLCMCLQGRGLPTATSSWSS